MRELWRWFSKRANAAMIEGAAHGLVFVGLVMLLARVWRIDRRQRLDRGGASA